MTQTKIAFLLGISIFFSPISMGTSFNCDDLTFSKLQLSVHAANFLNIKTTRTPEGGAYKPKIVLRKSDGKLDIESRDFFKQVYEPGHPDGDVNGMVTYPNLDLENEKQAVTAAARFIEFMTNLGVCDSIVAKSGTSVLVKYTGDKFTTSDFFIFKTDGSLESWTSYPTSGEVYTAAF